MSAIAAPQKTLADWLVHLLNLHPRGVDMGLARVANVADRLGVRRPAPCCIVVGGTNGKGSTVAVLEQVLLAAGRTVGATVSPHLVRFNERVRVAGREVDDAMLCDAFAAIEVARGEISLSYFEFGMLAALWCFRKTQVDVAVIEVGLGGRLDAANVVESDVAIVTSVGIDHVEYLGPDRESIGWDKAHIARPGRPFVCGDAAPPRRLLAVVEQVGARLLQRDQDFRLRQDHDGLHYQGLGSAMHLAVTTTLYPENIACALAALESIGMLPVPEVTGAALARTVNRGRLQRVGCDPRVVVDVAHNPHATQRLVVALTTGAAASGLPSATGTHVVLGCLADKDYPGVVAALLPLATHFWFVDTQGERGLRATELAQALVEQAASLVIPSSCHDRLDDVLRAVRVAAAPTERILVCGCFQIAAGALRLLDDDERQDHPGERWDRGTP